MNQPFDPLASDVVDELLSADLDGEFDAAARDHGLSAAEARARLEATPRAEERRHALEAARGALTTPVPVLGADARDALLAAAREGGTGRDELAHRRESRRPARFAGIAVAAAAVLLVVGLAVSIATTDSSGDDDSSAAGGAATTPDAATENASPDALAPSVRGDDAAGTQVHSFGAVADESALRASVLAALTSDTAASGIAGEQDSAEPQSREDLAATDDRCIAAQAGAFELGPAPLPVLRGPVEYNGTAGEVLVFAQGDDYLVLTVAADDCQLLVSQFVHPEP